MINSILSEMTKMTLLMLRFLMINPIDEKKDENHTKNLFDFLK